MLSEKSKAAFGSTDVIGCDGHACDDAVVSDPPCRVPLPAATGATGSGHIAAYQAREAEATQGLLT